MTALGKAWPPASLQASLSRQGFAWMEDALEETLFLRLRDEVEDQRSRAETASGDEEVPYRSRIAGLGEAAHRFLSGPAVRDLLGAAFGADLVLSQDASCCTYYGGGDRLGLHRDTPDACVATLILYLSVAGDAVRPANTGLALRVYGEARPQAGEQPLVVIPTRAATLVLGWGSRFWHERPELQPGEAVTALTACYRRAVD